MRRFFCLFILVLTVVIVSCADDDRFDDEIHSLGYSSMSRSVPMYSLEDLMSTAKPNFIFIGEVTSRGDSRIIDHSEKYSDASLDQMSTDEKQRCALAFLSTPYTIHIDKLILSGDDYQASANIKDDASAITLEAPYGILDDGTGNQLTRRDGEHPVLEVGKKYLFFMRRDFVYGDEVFYLAFPPVSALEIQDDGKFSGEYKELVDTVFGEFDGDIAKLLERLDSLISTGDYDLSSDSLGSAADKFSDK